MAQLHSYEIILLVAAIALQAAVAARIWQKGLRREYPALLRLCVVMVASSLVGMAVLRFASQQAYCYFYWFSELVIDGLALAVTLEIFRDVFKPYEALQHFGTIMFRWIIAVMLLVSAVSAISTGSVRAADLINSVSLMFDRGLMILQCGVVLFLLLTNRYIGLSFRHRSFGIAVGFGVNASVSLLALSAAVWAPISMIQALGGLMNVAGRVGEIIWLGYFFLPQPERRISDAAPESRRWEYALASIHAPAPEAMFLSNIDRTVERLLTKNNVATQPKPKEDKHWFGD